MNRHHANNSLAYEREEEQLMVGQGRQSSPPRLSPHKNGKGSMIRPSSTSSNHRDNTDSYTSTSSSAAVVVRRKSDRFAEEEEEDEHEDDDVFDFDPISLKEPETLHSWGWLYSRCMKCRAVLECLFHQRVWEVGETSTGGVGSTTSSSR